MTSAQTRIGKGTVSTEHVQVHDVTVLCGGPGVEREVSLESGRSVCDALRRLGFEVTMCDIGPEDLSALERPTDFVFIALHGEFGEDGTVQAQLEARGLPYAGCGVQASKLAMDKASAKQAFERASIPTPAFEVVDSKTLTGLSNRFSPPAVVKPLASGSSVDTTLVYTRDTLQQAAADLVERQGKALVEKCIQGPELTVGILDDIALPVCEIRTTREFYDYQAKYVDDNTEYLFDLDLPQDLLRRVQDLSLAAHRALGCEVFSRADWMIDGSTNEPYILEINTIPGFTSHSLVPKAAARIGIDFDELCRRIVELSMAVKRS